MADIEIVIKIPEEEYKCVQITGCIGNKTCISNAIYNGTPLPKGHGALKDVDKIGLTNFECFLCNGDYKEALKMLIEKIKNTDTVIEADKE